MVHAESLDQALARWDVKRGASKATREFFSAAPGGVPTQVAFSQAALGAEIEVPTLRGASSIEVEPGSANGTVHRIRHEGIEHLHGRGRGDLFVHLVVDVPTELDDTSRDLLRQLAEHRGEAVKEHAGGLFSRRRGSKK